MTILIKPSAKIELLHRASYFSHGLNSGLITVAAKSGIVTVISPDLTIQATLKRPHKIKDVALHPSLLLLGLVEDEDNHLLIVDVEGTVTYQSSLPETDEPPGFDIEGSGSCYFEHDGLHLWYAFARSSDDIEIQWLDCNDWRVLHRIVIKDPYGESHVSIHPTGTSERMALWLAGGQDGQQVYWLTAEEAKIVCEIEPLLEDTTPPVFSPSGKEFLTIDGDAIINKYQYPGVQSLGTYEWSGDEEVLNDLFYIDNERAAIISSEGNIFHMDLTAMVLLEEVYIENHEPQPVPVYYPTLSDDGSKCTDISRMEKFGNTLIFVFQREGGQAISSWKDSLLFAPLTALSRPNRIGG